MTEIRWIALPRGYAPDRDHPSFGVDDPFASSNRVLYIDAIDVLAALNHPSGLGAEGLKDTIELMLAREAEFAG